MSGVIADLSIGKEPAGGARSDLARCQIFQRALHVDVPPRFLYRAATAKQALDPASAAYQMVSSPVTWIRPV